MPLLIASIFLGAAFMSPEAVGEPPGAAQLNASAAKLVQASDNFLALAEANVNHATEYQTASDLSGVASNCAEYLNAAAALLLIYEAISSPTDRLRVKEIINRRLASYAKLIDNRTKLASLRLARAQSSALVRAGTRLRDMLHETGMLLRTLEIP